MTFDLDILDQGHGSAKLLNALMYSVPVSNSLDGSNRMKKKSAELIVTCGSLVFTPPPKNKTPINCFVYVNTH